MQCLCEILFPPHLKQFLERLSNSEEAALAAACKLNGNFQTVVKDITNQGPKGVNGGSLTQTTLTRLPSDQAGAVQAMLKAVSYRLVGKEATGPSKPEEAKVWMQAAIFFSSRIQDSPLPFGSRDPDMTPASAEQLRTVLAQIEAASKLMSNMEKVVLDITNPNHHQGVNGGHLTQPELKRLDRAQKSIVEAMLTEVCNRLLGHSPKMPSQADLLVWMKAACFFGQRIQTEENSHECGRRAPDMSTLAGGHLRKTVASMEAALKLMSNQEMVAKDITNPGQAGVAGGEKALSQTHLKRVDVGQRTTVDNMLKALICCLHGEEASGPSTPEEATVWAQAATYLSERIQGTVEACPSRAPDMSNDAARMMRKMLARIEASSKLMSNRDRVTKDITNPGPSAIGGGKLTQTHLQRVKPEHQEAVAAMVREVCACLLGKKMSVPSTPGVAQVWVDAAVFLTGRIQDSDSACPGRNPDMSRDAAAAMCTVLAQMKGRPVKVDTVRDVIAQLVVQPEKIAAPNWEAAQKLLSNRERVVRDITNPGPQNIDGKELTQTDLKRLDRKDRAVVDAMMIEVSCRLLGKKVTQPSQEDAKLWKDAALYFSSRIQSTPEQKAGRKPDMSPGAASALADVLKQI